MTGVRSMVGPLRRVAVRPPAEGDYLAAGWRAVPDPIGARTQHAEFVAALTEAGAQVDVLPPAPGMPDACFTYDPVFVTGRGAITLQQAKPARAREPELLTAELEGLGIGEIGRLTGAARSDAGDLYWLDDHTVAAGRSYRTNAAAHAQLSAILAAEGVELLPFDLPHDQGPEFVLHLMSFISGVADDLAIVYEPLAPVALLEALVARGVRWLPVTADEYERLGCNVLATEPGKVIAFAGAPKIVAALRAEGVAVTVVEMDQLGYGDGGPTCLTRPLVRD